LQIILEYCYHSGKTRTCCSEADFIEDLPQQENDGVVVQKLFKVRLACSRFQYVPALAVLLLQRLDATRTPVEPTKCRVFASFREASTLQALQRFV